MTLRIETVHGRHLVCGGILPANCVRPGQTWASADGSNRIVQVDEVGEDWVRYSWTENEVSKSHEKLAYSFQCRYCLVVPTSEIPKELI